MTDSLDLLTELPFGLPGKIYRSPMPFGPYDRQNQVWQRYLEKSIQQVVILVEKQEYLVHARRDLPHFYRAAGLEVLHYPIPDFQVPERDDGFTAALGTVLAQARAGNNIAVHCMAGLGRTGLFLACMAKQSMILDGEEAIDWVRQFIPEALENPQQEQFVRIF